MEGRAIRMPAESAWPFYICHVVALSRSAPSGLVLMVPPSLPFSSLSA